MNPLDVPMVANDAGVDTVGQYLVALAKSAWGDGYGYEGLKRPFGNSGWKHEVYSSLARADLIERSIAYQDEDYIEYNYNNDDADKIILDVFDSLLDPARSADHAIEVKDDSLGLMHPPLCDKSACRVSEAAARTAIPVPDENGRYPAWVDTNSGELRIDETDRR